MPFAFKDRKTAETLKRLAQRTDPQGQMGYVPSWETQRSPGDKVLLPGRKIPATEAFLCYPKDVIPAATYTKIGNSDRVVPGSGTCVVLRRFRDDEGGSNELIPSQDEAGNQAEIEVWNLFPVELRYGQVPGSPHRTGPCAAGATGPLLLVVKDPWGDHYVAEIYGRLGTYKLTHCFDRNREPLYVTADLERCVGKVVRLKELEGCWLVERLQRGEMYCPEPLCLTVVGVHNQCEDCLDCYKLEDCQDANNTQTTNTDLSLYENKAVRLKGDPYRCWKVSRQKQCQGASPVEVEEDYEDCNACLCYELEFCFTDASSQAPTEKTTTNLARALGLASPQDAVGKVVKLAELQGCWKITGTTGDCTGASKLTVLEEVGSCSQCECTLLEDCTTGARQVVSKASLFQSGDPLDLGGEYSGQVVRLNDGKCYKVLQGASGLCYIAPTSAQVLEAYNDCTACQQGLTELENCQNTAQKIKTYSDLSGFGPVQVGNVYIRDDGTCWRVSQTNLAWSGLTSDYQEFVAVGRAPDCANCNTNYRLSASGCRLAECDDQPGGSATPRDRVVSHPKLLSLVGKYLKLEGHCYQVSTTQDPVDGDLAGWDGQAYESCQDCLQAPFTAMVPIVTDICEDTDGKLQVRWARLVIRNGQVVGLCDQGCEKPPACTSECDTGDGGGGNGGGGGSGVNCAGCNDIPATLTATFTDDSGTGCPCLDGVQVQTVYDSNTGKWTGSTSACGGTLNVEIFCDGQSNTLVLNYGCPNTSQNSVGLSISSCNGVGGFQANGSTFDNGCCQQSSGVPISISVTG